MLPSRSPVRLFSLSVHVFVYELFGCCESFLFKQITFIYLSIYLFIHLSIYLFICVCVLVCVRSHTPQHTCGGQRISYRQQFSHRVGPRDPTQVSRLGGNHLYPPSHLTDPVSLAFCVSRTVLWFAYRGVGPVLCLGAGRTSRKGGHPGSGHSPSRKFPACGASECPLPQFCG